MGRSTRAANKLGKVACAGLAAAMITAPIRGSSQPYPPYPPPGVTPGDHTAISTAPPPPPADTSGHFPWWLVLVGVGVAVAASASSAHADATPSKADLLARGPVMPPDQPIGTVTFYGFVRNGWPIVADYAADPKARTTLTVTVGDRAWTVPLPGGHRLVHLPYEGDAAEGSSPARFALTSERLDAAGRPIPSNIQITGFGCGPRALGSVAIEDLSFRVSAPPAQGDFARFDYRAESFFNRTVSEVLRYGGRTEHGVDVVTVTPVASYSADARPPGTYGPGVWDGLQHPSHRASHGAHGLRVRAWETDGDESWVAAIADDVVWVP